MSICDIKDLIKNCSEPLEKIEYSARREKLLLAFRDHHNLYTWDEIEKAIQLNKIDESMLVEEWIELQSFKRFYEQ